jgi:hypothetical protein
MKTGFSMFIMGGNTLACIFAGRAAGSEVARSPLGQQTHGWIIESCFRGLPRWPNAFLLPEGEG